MSEPSYAGLHHVKIPVTDLDTALDWYGTVFRARREPRFDHHDVDGKRFAIITFWPGIETPCELRLAPKAARAVAGYDPITFGVTDESALQRWVDHFDTVGVVHSGIISGFMGKLVNITSPDGLDLRLYTMPVGGFVNMEFRPDLADLNNPSLKSGLMESN